MDHLNDGGSGFQPPNTTLSILFLKLTFIIKFGIFDRFIDRRLFLSFICNLGFEGDCINKSDFLPNHPAVNINDRYRPV